MPGLWGLCPAQELVGPSQRGGVESGPKGRDHNISGKRTDNMATLMVLSAQSLAQNRPRGPGLNSERGFSPPPHQHLFLLKLRRSSWISFLFFPQSLRTVGKRQVCHQPYPILSMTLSQHRGQEHGKVSLIPNGKDPLKLIQNHFNHPPGGTLHLQPGSMANFEL